MPFPKLDVRCREKDSLDSNRPLGQELETKEGAQSREQRLMEKSERLPSSCIQTSPWPRAQFLAAVASQYSLKPVTSRKLLNLRRDGQCP